VVELAGISMRPGTMWQYVFLLLNAKFRDELFYGEIFYPFTWAQFSVEPRHPHFKVGTGGVGSSPAVLK
ncbi:uncharacterized protein METZ01_LOCUS166339, partial [marine metagenome]